jgi:hypothetical protein
MSAVDSCSGFALGGDERAARALNRVTATAHMGATTSSGAESKCPGPRVLPIRGRNHHWKWWHPYWLSTRVQPARASRSSSRQNASDLRVHRRSLDHFVSRKAAAAAARSHIQCPSTKGGCRSSRRSNHVTTLPRAGAPCRSRRASCPARGACTPASTTATGGRAAPARRGGLRHC